MRRICTEKERQIVESCESMPERERLLQALWSMKESIVKWNGRGMGYGMERVDCSKWLKSQHNAHCFTKLEQKTCPTRIKNAGGRQTFDSSVEGRTEWESQTLQKQTKEEIVCGRNPAMKDESEDKNPERWMLLRQESEYTLAACTAARAESSGHRPKAVQIIKVREEELYK